MRTEIYRYDVAVAATPDLAVTDYGRQVWLTSDQHFGHKNIISLCRRPWPDTDTMREGLIANHNSVVADDDIVIHLGDFAFLSETDMKRVLHRLRGVHYLVPGNHDPRNPITLREIGFKVLDPGTLDVVLAAILGQGWQRQQPFLMQQALYLDVSDILVSHYPRRGSDMHTDRHDAASPTWSGPIIHGHVHHQWAMNPATRYRGAQYNVGVDVRNWFPVPIDSAVQALRDAATALAERCP